MKTDRLGVVWRFAAASQKWRNASWAAGGVQITYQYHTRELPGSQDATGPSRQQLMARLGPAEGDSCEGGAQENAPLPTLPLHRAETPVCPVASAAWATLSALRSSSSPQGLPALVGLTLSFPWDPQPLQGLALIFPLSGATICLPKSSPRSALPSSLLSSLFSSLPSP